MRARGRFCSSPCTVLSHQVTQTLQWAVRSWTELESSIVSVERMQDYARTPKEVTGGGWEGPALWDLQQRAVAPGGPLPRAVEPTTAWGLEPGPILGPLLPRLGEQVTPLSDRGHEEQQCHRHITAT